MTRSEARAMLDTAFGAGCAVAEGSARLLRTNSAMRVTPR